MMKIRFYQTFEEMIAASGYGDSFTAFRNWLIGKAKQMNSGNIDNKFEDVYKILINRHWTDYVLYRDYYFEDTINPNFTPSFTTDDYPNCWCREFCEVYLSTCEKYLVLLNFYAAEKANLLNRIGSVSKNKYNDTPQNGGDFDNDEHLSTINTTTVEQDVAPLINRLDDISKLYQNVLSDWADEFKHLFIPQGVNDYE